MGRKWKFHHFWWTWNPFLGFDFKPGFRVWHPNPGFGFGTQTRVWVFGFGFCILCFFFSFLVIDSVLLHNFARHATLLQKLLFITSGLQLFWLVDHLEHYETALARWCNNSLTYCQGLILQADSSTLSHFPLYDCASSLWITSDKNNASALLHLCGHCKSKEFITRRKEFWFMPYHFHAMMALYHFHKLWRAIFFWLSEHQDFSSPPFYAFCPFPRIPQWRKNPKSGYFHQLQVQKRKMFTRLPWEAFLPTI